METMSQLCPGSEKLLYLSPDELSNLQLKHKKQSPTRLISILIKFRATYNGESQSLGTLGRLEVQESEQAICGTCSFCLLLGNAVQQTFDSIDWNWPSYHPYLDESLTEVDVCIQLITFAYSRDISQWAVGQESVSTNSVYALKLKGYTWLQGDTSKITESQFKMDFEVAFELFAKPDDPLAQLLDIHRRALDVSPLSAANLANIKSWMRDCDENHDVCWEEEPRGTRDTGQFVPSRLLYVGSSDESRAPRLIITRNLLASTQSDCMSTFKYIALSYCWGPPSEARTLLKTMHASLPARLEGISQDSMPLVFRDVITVAHALGIEYIWIDSLCIIQDDSRDWEIESSRMADIFSNAYLTIAAATGISVNHSFLQRDPLPTCDIPVKWPQHGLASSQFSLRPRRAWGTDKMSEIVNSRWVNRGWTFQEERLTRRTLMFGKNKFFLDCRTLERAEDTDKYRFRPDWVDSVSRNTWAVEDGNARKSKYTYKQTRTPCDHWQTLCSHYSYRKLTYPDDKLPAISGVANRFAQRMSCVYLAGLWRDNLAHDLLWYAASYTQPTPKYRTPSWSWASRDGNIFWPQWRDCNASECHMYCRILSAVASPSGLDPFGAVSSGHLKIHGSLLDVQVTCARIQGKPFVDGTGDSTFIWRLSIVGDEVGVADARLDTVERFDDEERVYTALLVSRCPSSKRYRTKARGLLLQVVDGEMMDGVQKYRRVGSFEIPPHMEGNSQLWVDAENRTVVIV